MSQLVELFRGCSTSHISDSMRRLPGTTRLRPMHRRGTLLGTALTVKVRSGDNLIVHKALQKLRPGNVLVVDGDGDTSRALVGEIMKRIAQSKGCVGFVVNGAIRDLNAFAQDDFPCFALSVTHRGPYKNGPGDIDLPVVIDGLLISPGDVVVGDGDGVVAVPLEQAAKVAAAGHALMAKEAELIKQIADGSYDQTWVDKTMAALGQNMA